MFRQIGQALRPNSRRDNLVEMLRPQARTWTVESLRVMIQAGPTDDFIREIAAYVKDKPELWFVGDDDFIEAVRVLNAQAATLFATPQGLNFMHLMGEQVRNRLAGQTVGGLIGGIFGVS